MRCAGAPLMLVDKEQSEEASEGAKEGSSRLLKAVVPLVCIVLQEVDGWGADCVSRLKAMTTPHSCVSSIRLAITYKSPYIYALYDARILTVNTGP